jgi:hypothetical protein
MMTIRDLQPVGLSCLMKNAFGCLTEASVATVQGTTGAVQQAFTTPSGTAALSAAVVGTLGAVTGGTCGMLAGTACGIATAWLTLGLSIPIGAGIGLCTGASTGGSAGMICGAVAGYSGFQFNKYRKDPIAREPPSDAWLRPMPTGEKIRAKALFADGPAVVFLIRRPG